MNRIRCLCAAGALALLAGCAAWQPHEASKVQATQRWNAARGDVKLRLAQSQLEAGRPEAALVELAAARDLDPALPGLDALEVRILLARGDLTGAERVMERGGPDTAERAYLRGVIAQQRARWDDARTQFSEALRLSPGDAAYLVAAVQATLQGGDAAAALQLLRERGAGSEWTPAFHAAAAECHEQLGDWDHAALAWQRVAAGADDPALRERWALALFRARQWREARPLLDEALQRALRAPARPDQPPATLRLALAECMLELGETDRAAAMLFVAVREAPRSPRAFALLARALAGQNDYSRAATAADQAVKLDDGVSRELLELAAALNSRAGRTARARGYANILAADGDSAVAAHILAGQ